MDAEAINRLWRRILRSDVLSEALLAHDFPARASDLGLSPEEAQVVSLYAENASATRWAIEGYRYRLVSVAAGALQHGAPFTLRVLEAHGHDARTLVRGFLTAVDYRDDGPFTYRTCADILDYLRTDPVLADVPALADVIALEAAKVALLRSLANVPLSAWAVHPDVGGTPPAASVLSLAESSTSAVSRYRRSPAATLVTTEHVLDPWLKDENLAGRSSLERRPRHILVYLQSIAEPPAYVLLGDVTRDLFEALDEPRTLVEAASAIQLSSNLESAHRVLGKLLGLGVVHLLPSVPSVGDLLS